MMIGEKCADMLKEDARGEEASRRRRGLERRTGGAARDRPLPAGAPAVRRAGAPTSPTRGGRRRAREVSGGETIFSQGADPVEHLRIVRTGSVEIVADGRVLDLLGEGELFGHASMLSGLPTGFEARAAQDTLCYRIGAGVARGLLAAPAGLRYVARSLLEPPTELAPAGPRAGARPGRRAGRRAAPRRASSAPRHADPRGGAADDAAARERVVVELGDGSLGILTDRDLRTRVLAVGLAGDAPVSAAMSAPAYTCRPTGRRRRAAGDARPRPAPLPGRVGSRRDPRGDRGHGPGRRAHALVVLPARAHRRRRPSRARERGPRAAADGDLDARGERRGGN